MTSDASARFRAAATAAAVPPALHAAWNGPVPDPSPGQVWRANIGDVTELILLVTVSESRVTAAPASIDPDYADDTARIVPADTSPLGIATTIWLDLAQAIAVRTLDRYAGQLTLGHADVPAAVRALGQPGCAVVSAAQPAAEYRARLADCMDSLAAVTVDIPGTGELPGLLRDRGIKLDRLVELGMATPRALAVTRGSAAVNEDEATALAAELQRTVDDILTANPAPPIQLVTWLDQPRRRRQIEQLAQQRDLGDEEARIHAAYDVYALAAREPGGSLDWNNRLDRYFELALDA